jgi:hypothetical protein
MVSIKGLGAKCVVKGIENVGNIFFIVSMAVCLGVGIFFAGHMMRWLGEGDRMLFIIAPALAWIGTDNAFALGVLGITMFVTAVICVILVLLAFFGPLLIGLSINDKFSVWLRDMA